MDWDALIKAAENQLAKALAARVVEGVIAKLPWLAGLSGPLGFLVGIVIGQLVKYGDWLAYLVGKGWENSAAGEKFQKAGEALENLPKDASKEEREAAEKAKADAFDDLMDAP